MTKTHPKGVIVFQGVKKLKRKPRSRSEVAITRRSSRVKERTVRKTSKTPPKKVSRSRLPFSSDIQLPNVEGLRQWSHAVWAFYFSKMEGRGGLLKRLHKDS